MKRPPWTNDPAERTVETVTAHRNPQSHPESAIERWPQESLSIDNYKAFLRESPEGICVIQDGWVKYVNPALQKMIGYAPPDLPADFPPFNAYVHPEELPRLAELYGRLLRGEDRQQCFKTILLHKTGHPVQVEVKSIWVDDFNGQGAAMLFIRDITEWKQAERTLQESESKLRQIIDLVPHFIFAKDCDGRYLLANQSLAEAYGTTVEQLQGKSDADFNLFPAGVDRFLSDDRQVINGKQPKVIPLEKITDALGRVRYLQTIKIPFTQSATGQEALLGVCTDITQQQVVEEALQESEREWMTIFDAIGQPILILDPNHHILQANQAVYRMFGRDRMEIIGRSCFELFHGKSDHQAPENCPMNHIMNSGETEPVEMEMESLGGTYLVACTPILDTRGNIQKIIHIATDITSMKKAEEEREKLQSRILQIQKMEAIGTLAGGIAHDFNNILMGIQGYASLMLYDAASDYGHRTKLENIQNYTKRGADLTKQLLGLARGTKYDVQSTDMNILLGKSADMFGRMHKEISICKNFKNDLWPANVDHGQMDQVLLNLFINAAQAMPDGGKLILASDNVLLDDPELNPAGMAKGRYIKISVTDNGIGMDSKTRARIFEPFFTTKPKGTGTGLGLASSYAIIKNHNGAIHVYSEPGQGTTFNIYLPAVENMPISEEAPEEKIYTGTETILIVDDEFINITVMKKMLEMLHYHVRSAGSGNEAIDIVNDYENQIDLVILDMVMPGMGGGQVFDIIRKIQPKLPIILASGYSAEGEARNIMERGCEGFIQKPFQLHELSKMVRETLDRRLAPTAT